MYCQNLKISIDWGLMDSPVPPSRAAYESNMYEYVNADGVDFLIACSYGRVAKKLVSNPGGLNRTEGK